MKHFAIVGVLVVAVTIIVDVLLEGIGLMPIQASTQSGPIDGLFSLHVKAISFLFALIVVFLVYAIVVFRRRPGETGDGDHFEGHTGLEIVWSVIPLAIVLYFSYLGAEVLAETRQVDPQAIEVKVVSFQWGWRFEYPEYGVTSSTLNLPVNRQVLLKLTSTDVIHSFWVPEFRVKQDALPGETMVKELRITPSQVGRYKVRCAELCGTAHSYMEGGVVVMQPADFDAWIAEQAKGSDDPVERGRKLATTQGCIGCHTADGTAIVGPTWKGLAGKQERLEGGVTAVVDDAYLRAAIIDPDLQIVEGFKAKIMPPTYGKTLSAEQIDDLIAYIKSLK